MCRLRKVCTVLPNGCFENGIKVTSKNSLFITSGCKSRRGGTTVSDAFGNQRHGTGFLKSLFVAFDGHIFITMHLSSASPAPFCHIIVKSTVFRPLAGFHVFALSPEFMTAPNVWKASEYILSINQEDYMSVRNGIVRSVLVMMSAAVFFGAFAASCNENDPAAVKTPDCVKYTNAKKGAPQQAAASKQETAIKKELLFFMNPYGRPCQMQDAIIQEKLKDIGSVATVRYIKTSESADRALFGHYGIRGLPSLVVIDDKGNEVHRFSPGVQDGDAIIQVLRK